MRYASAIAWGNVRLQRGCQLTKRYLPLSIITGQAGWWCGMRPNRGDHFWGGGAFTPWCFPKIPFRFRRTSWSPSERLVSSKHWWDCSPTPEEGRCYFIQIRVTLGDRGGNQPPLSYAWGGWLITNILKEAWQKDWITEAIVLSPGKAILFFGRCSKNEGLPYHSAKTLSLA